MIKSGVMWLLITFSGLSFGGVIPNSTFSLEERKQFSRDFHLEVLGDGSIYPFINEDSPPEMFDSTNNGVCLLDGPYASTSSDVSYYSFTCESGIVVSKSIHSKNRHNKQCIISWDSNKFEYVSYGCDALPRQYETSTTTYNHKPTHERGNITADDIVTFDQYILKREEEYKVASDVREHIISRNTQQTVVYSVSVVGTLSLLFAIYKFYIMRLNARKQFKARVREAYKNVSSKMVEYAHNGIVATEGSPVVVYESIFNECVNEMRESGLFSDAEVMQQKHEFNNYIIDRVINVPRL